MKILLVSDIESPYFWDYYRPGKLDEFDLILSAGDLKPDYLSFLVTMAHAPLLYVHGNHDGIYERFPPEGCDCIDGKFVKVKGLRIVGLGGCQMYNKGPHQYTESQMQHRIWKLWWKMHGAHGFDILLTHAPAADLGDEPNPVHRGFQCFRDLMEEYQPPYMVHGHIHPRYNEKKDASLRFGATTIINACGYKILEIPDPET